MFKPCQPTTIPEPLTLNETGAESDTARALGEGNTAWTTGEDALWTLQQWVLKGQLPDKKQPRHIGSHERGYFCRHQS